jgi:hypothetical protein
MMMMIIIIIIVKILGSHSGDYEEFYLLGYNDVSSVESQQTFRRNMSPPSSESKNNPSKKQAELAACLCWFLAWLIL